MVKGRIDKIRKKTIYNYVLLKSRVKRVFSGNVEPKYLFVLSPPYSGSTLVTEALIRCREVTCNNVLDNLEGQFLFEVREEMRKDPWNPDQRMNWEEIKAVWERYWDPTRKIHLEKSPPNILRAWQLASCFDPAYFICIIRNPYATIEGIRRRSINDVTLATEFWVKCAAFQYENILTLPDLLLLKYEEIVEDGDAAAEKVRNFMPELEDISFSGKFSAHNVQEIRSELTNFNDEKIRRLSPPDIASINSVLKRNMKYLDFFGYSLIGIS